MAIGEAYSQYDDNEDHSSFETLCANSDLCTQIADVRPHRFESANKASLTNLFFQFITMLEQRAQFLRKKFDTFDQTFTGTTRPYFRSNDLCYSIVAGSVSPEPAMAYEHIFY